VRASKNYLLALLTVIAAFNYTDRFALGVVLQDIKVDLHLSDSQLGFLSGIAFALFYALMGIPIGRWADRGDRIGIISLTTAIWSLAVALCGAAASFAQLMLIRVVVGVGEAGCVPPSLSLIADYFMRAERPRSVAIFMQGISASLVIGYIAAGWLNQLFGWRVMFVVIGLPGLGLAALARLTVADRRVSEAKSLGIETTNDGFMAVLARLWSSVTFRHVLLSCAINWFFSYGTLQWTPTFFVRSFGLKTGPLGTWFAVVVGLGCALGTYWGGEWAARRAVSDERRQLLAMAVVTCGSAVCMAFVFTPFIASNAHWAFVWLGLATILANAVNGPQFAVLQTLVPERMRATSIAIVYLFANLIGIGLGPWAAGALSDALQPWLGDESLRYAMLALCPGFIWSAWHLRAASKTAMRDVEVAKAIQEPAVGA
jgi:MFS transporter, Spinster family, sphingosine-1-phosphate transporter